MNDTTKREMTEDPKVIEIRRIRRLLKEINKLADHASLTGSLRNGASEAAEMYNLSLHRLKELGIDATVLFRELPTDAGFDKVGVASKLLYGYLEEDETDTRRFHAPNIVIGNLSGLGDLDKLKDLGQTIRENLRDFLRDKLEDTEVEVNVRREKPAKSEPTSEPETVRRDAGQEATEPMPMPSIPNR
jgi:hypothetical protein